MTTHPSNDGLTPEESVHSRERLVTSQSGQVPAGYLELARLRTPGAYRARRVAAIILAVIAPLIGAWIATGRDRWDLFAKSGSITSAVGLLLASRRYLGRGVLELAMLQLKDESRSRMVELLEDIYTAKLGLGLSAFGIVIWGWGQDLRWWSFSYLVVWGALEARNAWRDFVQLRDTPIGAPPAGESKNPTGADS